MGAATATRQNQHKSLLPSGEFKKLLLVFFIGLLAWAYQAAQPPLPKTCGSRNGPPVTAPRIRLSDGRHLAYKEHGVSKDKAKYKIVFFHGIDSCRHDVGSITSTLSPDAIENLGIYIVSFDRPGYGESDPNPNRTLKNMASDVEELADQLGLGSKFYVIGFSMGGQAVWPCLNYIPHRLAGAALINPVVNYWWPSLPANLSGQAFSEVPMKDRWAFRVAHYTPWLTYWWNTRKVFSPLGILALFPAVLSRQDQGIMSARPARDYEAHVRQQGDFETIYRDLMIGFGDWGFDPVEVENPFPENDGSVHLWQGDEDKLVPASLQRFIAENLPWIQYHEVMDNHKFDDPIYSEEISSFADEIVDKVFDIISQEPSQATRGNLALEFYNCIFSSFKVLGKKQMVCSKLLEIAELSLGSNNRYLVSTKNFITTKE